MMDYLNEQLITRFESRFFIGICVFCKFAPHVTGESMMSDIAKKRF